MSDLGLPMLSHVPHICWESGKLTVIFRNSFSLLFRWQSCCTNLKVREFAIPCFWLLLIFVAEHIQGYDILNRNNFIPVLGHSTELGPQAHFLRTFNLSSPNSLELVIEKWTKLYTKLGKMGKHAVLLAGLEGTSKAEVLQSPGRRVKHIRPCRIVVSCGSWQ